MGPNILILVIVVLAYANARPRLRHHMAKELRQCILKTEKLESILQSSPMWEYSGNLTLEDKTASSGTKTNDVRKLQAIDPDTEDSREPRYKLLLNEVNSDNPGPDTTVFFELKAIRREVEGSPDTSDVYGFMLLLLKGEPLSIMLSLDIGLAVHRVKNEFITIGKKSELKNVDIDFYAPEVNSAYESTYEPLLPFDDVPHGILLLHVKLESIRAELSLEKVNGVYRPIPLGDDDRRQRLIRNHVVDLIVIAKKSPYSYCDFFESLKPRSFIDPERRTVLRDWEGSNGLPFHADYTIDKSLSRCCSDNRAFDQDCWRLGAPTPDAANLCENKQPFYLEELIANMRASELPLSEDRLMRRGLDSDQQPTNIVTSTPTNIPDSRGQCHAGYPGVSASVYGLINDHAYAKAVEKELARESDCQPAVETSAQPDNSEEEAMEVEESNEPLMVPRHVFNHDNFEACKRYLTKVNEIKVPAITSWLDVIYENRQCKFRCYNCQLYLQKGFRPDIKQPPLFVTTGYFSSASTRNKAHIVEHISPENREIYRLHQDATTFVDALRKAETTADVRAAEKAAHENQKLIYKPTMNALKLAYAELRSEISFRSHEIFFEAVKELGVDLGSYHGTDHALRIFAETFSEAFHERLLLHLNETQPPFSFIVDATTSRNTGFLICLMQTIENGYPVLHMWRLIELTKSESGKNMMDDISTWIDTDDRIVNGFKEYFKSKMVTFISDRGSAMVGQRKGLIAFLRQYTGKDIQSVSCSAHKTETAIKHALDVATGEALPNKKPPKWFAQIGDYNNKIYTYYMSRGSKRFASLLEVGEELGVSASRIKYHHSIRWSASKKAATEALLKNIDVVREDLRRSASSTDKDTREKATTVYDIVTDKHFCTALAELADMLSISEAMLNAFQLKHGLLLGISDTIRTGLRGFENRKKDFGRYLKGFLQKTSCSGVCEEKACTLEEYDSCESVIYRPELDPSKDEEVDEEESEFEDSSDDSEESVQDDLESDNTVTLVKKSHLPFVPLSLWRNNLYDRIIQEVKTLFNVKDLEAFDALHPKNYLFTCPHPSVPPCQVLSSCFKPFAPIHSADVPEDIDSKLRRICAFYKINECDQVIKNFQSLVSAIVVSERYKLLSNEVSKKDTHNPARFWSYAFDDASLLWQPDVRGLVQLILVTDQSSASAERAFSALTRLRSGDRSNLMPTMLDALIRISLNGPKTIDWDNLYKYSLTFLKKHKRVDQNDRVATWKTAEGDQKLSSRMYYTSRIYSAT